MKKIKVQRKTLALWLENISWKECSVKFLVDVARTLGFNAFHDTDASVVDGEIVIEGDDGEPLMIENKDGEIVEMKKMKVRSETLALWLENISWEECSVKFLVDVFNAFHDSTDASVVDGEIVIECEGEDDPLHPGRDIDGITGTPV